MNIKTLVLWCFDPWAIGIVDAWPFLQVMSWESWEWLEIIISNGEPAKKGIYNMGEHPST
jgi:hypothetical protein